MLTDRAEGLMRISRLIKYLIVAAAVLLTTQLAATPDTSIISIQATLVPATIVFLTLTAFGPTWFYWSRTWFRRPMQTALKLAAVECALTTLALIGTHAITPDESVQSLPASVIFATSGSLLLLLNRFLPDMIGSVLYRWRSPQRILTVGSGQAIGLIDSQLSNAARLGLIRVDHCPTVRSNKGIRLFDPDDTPTESLSPDDIEDVVLNHDSSLGIDRVVFVEDPKSGNNQILENELQRQCNSLGVPLTVYADLPVVPSWNNMPISLSDLAISRTPESPLQNPVNQFVKRCIDIIVSLPVVIFILPLLCVLVRSIHRKQSPGPLFYRQERYGRNGTTFRILKFRTMHVPAEGQTDIEADPGHRIFPLGAMLRDSRLDEIPQFINVLAGSMSIVGPRAHHAQDRIKFSKIVPHYPMRMQAKPGITGLAQYREYRGRFRRNSVEDRVDCDLTYIATWKLETDALLMVKTARLIGESLALAALRGWSDSKQHDVKPAVPVEPPSLMPDQRAA